MDMFLTGVCLQGTLVILSSAENNRVILSAEVRMRGRQGQQLRPGCWSCCYCCQLYETIHPPILCPDSPFELQNNDPTWSPTGKATSQGRTEGGRDREGGRERDEKGENDGKCHSEGVGGLIKTYCMFWTKKSLKPHKEMFTGCWLNRLPMKKTAYSHLIYSTPQHNPNTSAFLLFLAIET